MVARFAALNGISSSKARAFLNGREVLVDDFYGGKFWPSYTNEAELRRLARILDEPIAVVRTLNGDRLGLPVPYQFDRSRIAGGDSWKESVHYCPICLRAGYHAVFHEFSWLRRCPIHDAQLRQQSVGVRGNSQFDRYVNVLRHLFETESRQWLSINERQSFRSSVRTGSQGQRFSLFRGWVHAAQRASDAEPTIAIPYIRPYATEYLDILLGRLAWLREIPSEILPLFSVTPQWMTPRMEKLPSVAIEQARNLRDRQNIHFMWLIGFCKQTAALSAEATCFREAAKEYLLYLQRRHDTCACRWDWHFGSGWCAVRPGSKPFGDCPYAIAIEEVRQTWIEFAFGASRGNERHQVRGWYEYVKKAQDCLGKGAVAPIAGVDYSLSGQFRPQIPYVNWNLPVELTEMLHKLLLADFEAHRSELEYWLENAHSGNHPGERLAPPSSSLIIWKNGTWELMVWPTILRNRTGNSNGMWSPGR